MGQALQPFVKNRFFALCDFRRTLISIYMRSTKPTSTSVHSAVSGLLADLHAKSGCEKIGLTRESFSVILCEVATKYLPAGATHADARSFLLALRIDELALAQACAAGSNSAWELFLTRYREKLYQSALRIARKTQPPAT